MPYVKKIWSTQEKIRYQDLNNIENGLDDLHNNAITTSGIKEYNDDIIISNAHVANNVAISKLGIIRADLITNGTYALDIPENVEIRNNLSSYGDIEIGIINGIEFENHIHRTIDILNISSDIVVDVNGSGDYTNLASAISAVSANQCIYIKSGTYNITGDLNIPADVTIIGAGWNTKIIPTARIHMGNRSRLFNIYAESADIYFTIDNLSGSETVIEDCYVKNTSTNGVCIRTGTKDIVNSCTTYGPNGIKCGTDSIICNNIINIANTIGTSAGIDANTCIVIDNMIINLGDVNYGVGIYLQSTAWECIIAGNTIMSCSYGIYSLSTTSYNLYHGNIAMNYSVMGFYLLGTGNVNSENVS